MVVSGEIWCWLDGLSSAFIPPLSLGLPRLIPGAGGRELSSVQCARNSAIANADMGSTGRESARGGRRLSGLHGKLGLNGAAAGRTLSTSKTLRVIAAVSCPGNTAVICLTTSPTPSLRGVAPFEWIAPRDRLLKKSIQVSVFDDDVFLDAHLRVPGVCKPPR